MVISLFPSSGGDNPIRQWSHTFCPTHQSSSVAHLPSPSIDPISNYIFAYLHGHYGQIPSNTSVAQRALLMMKSKSKSENIGIAMYGQNQTHIQLTNDQNQLISSTYYMYTYNSCMKCVYWSFKANSDHYQSKKNDFPKYPETIHYLKVQFAELSILGFPKEHS